LRLIICACYLWEIVLNIGLDVYHSIKCRSGKEYERTQGKLLVRKLLYEMRFLVELSSVTLVSYKYNTFLFTYFFVYVNYVSYYRLFPIVKLWFRTTEDYPVNTPKESGIGPLKQCNFMPSD
jgi:hypothetical protein